MATRQNVREVVSLLTSDIAKSSDVPFRLTRDMIDVTGVAGIEGVFRRCCEETLSVMRINEEALSTIIEETGEEMETSLDDSEDAYEGNKELDRYEEGEMQSPKARILEFFYN